MTREDAPESSKPQQPLRGGQLGRVRLPALSCLSLAQSTWVDRLFQDTLSLKISSEDWGDGPWLSLVALAEAIISTF